MEVKIRESKESAIHETIAAKKEYVIEGHLRTMEGRGLDDADLMVFAFVNGEELARSEVNANGSYRLRFSGGESPPPATELCVLPKKLGDRAKKSLCVKKTVSQNRFMDTTGQNGTAYAATYDMLLPRDYVLFARYVTKSYRIHGAVYATTFQNIGGTPMPISIEPLPGARIEFFEVDAPWFHLIGTEPTLHESPIGLAQTGPDGGYDFEFDFTYERPWVWSWLFADTKPDIRARVSQSVDGTWKQVFEGPVDWDIAEDFHRDLFVPVEDTYPVPDAGVKPAVGFRFSSMGLLPIDETRIQKGYVTAMAGDPTRISAVSHQPLCGRLRIFGLFAETPAIASYQVQIADADEDGATGSWRNVADPLHNRKWNSSLNQWDPTVLGPDLVTGRYQNIDTEPEIDWQEHALKVTWNSKNEPNGYYALRVIGFDASSTQVGVYEMPVLRIDNSKPDASLAPVGTSLGSVTACGHMTLSTSGSRWIRFQVDAHDPEGHVRKYWIHGTRGKDAITAGGNVDETRPDPTDTWNGDNNELVDFPVDALPSVLASCPSVAYNFELHVHGLATDGYNVTPGAQRAKRQVNLVIAES